MKHYYFALPKDSQLDCKTNNKVSTAIMHNSYDSLSPFYKYIETSIKSMKNKEEITASWRKNKNDLYAELTAVGYIYNIPKETKIQISVKKGLYRIKNKIDEPDFGEDLKIKSGDKKDSFKIKPEDVTDNNKYISLPVEYDNIERANWGFETLDLEPAWLIPAHGDTVTQDTHDYKIVKVNNDVITIAGILNKNIRISIDNINLNCVSIEHNIIPKGNVIFSDGEKTIVYSDKKIGGYKEISNIQPYINLKNLKYKDNTPFNEEHLEKFVFRIKDNKCLGEIIEDTNSAKFKITELKNNSKDKWWIQLEEIDGAVDETAPSESLLKYFFDDDIKIQDSLNNIYSIAHGYASENRIILKDKDNKYCFPPDEAKFLKVKVNTYQLKRQKNAIRTLQDKPVGPHANLIRLFEKRDKIEWPDVKAEEITDWAVLTEEQRSGCSEQSEFVKNALGTPDFAILEGPPGSGKTTVILELICQLALLGKKVLLCGSTHVAIDNVLERLNEKENDQKSLLEKYNILPVRIGDEKRISDDIKEFQINNLIADNEIQEELLLDAANLVCGTTIGILQHPKFKKRSNNGNKEPVVPEFDYLIIDESSKTTFQEFLVPALYAKKWILAGDIMQLSPFTDREQTVSNLERLALKDDKTLTADVQNVCFYLYKIKELFKEKSKNKFVFAVKKSELESLLFELKARVKKGEFNNGLFKIITDEPGLECEETNISVTNFSNINYLELCAYDTIFLQKNIIDKILTNIPEIFAVLNYDTWKSTAHAFRHNYRIQKGLRFRYEERGKKYNNSFDIVESVNKFLSEKSWAEEIAWRIDREHQLRLSKKTNSNYRKVVSELIPRSCDNTDVENRINTIASIAFPSILESLVRGIPGRKNNKKTTISEGFTQEELRNRRTVLKYQHRMHPEISNFPRRQFYNNLEETALLDLEQPSHIRDMRQWDYNRYLHRHIWIDAKGETRRNYNENEVQKMIDELKYFIEFAKNNPQPEGKEWTVACLTFYRGQEKKIREKLQKLCKLENSISRFYIKDDKGDVNIKLHTVDKFQGQEADLVFLSMVQTKRDGFMDSPNRLNVAITRAKFQLVIIGDYKYFRERSRAECLKELAQETKLFED